MTLGEYDFTTFALLISFLGPFILFFACDMFFAMHS